MRSLSKQKVLMLCVLVFVAASYPQRTTPQSQAATNGSSQAPDQKSEEAKAARKKKFEEAKKRLESADPQQNSGEPSDASEQRSTLYISPVLVNMLVSETQGFSAFDAQGHNLTTKAEWSLSNSYVADLTTNGVPTITAKDHGTVTVRARFGSLSGEANVTVHTGDKLPIGTIRWQAPSIPGFKTKQIVQAVPR